MRRDLFSRARSFAAVFVVVVLVSAGALPFLSIANAQSGSTSCSDAYTLHWTLYGGVPASLNELATYNPSGYDVSDLAFLTAGAPTKSTTGVPLNYSTVMDSYSHNSNYTVWTFHIKDGMMWSNGQPITSTDVKNQWSPGFMLNPNYDVAYPPLHEEVVRIDTPDASTAVFYLNKTDVHLDLRISREVSSADLYPSDLTSKGSSDNFFGTSVGSGPFYVDNYQAGSNTLTMLRNPYWKPLPTVCKIVVNFIQDISGTPTYLASGATDFAYIPSGAAATLAALPNIKVLTQADELTTYLAYNQTEYPYNMTAFRQALVYGVNQSAIASIAFNGYARPGYSAQGYVPPSSAIYNPNQKQYRFDPQEALSLLSSIGITKGSDNFLHYPNGTVVRTTLWADDDVYSDAEAAPLVYHDLRALGFDIALQELPWGTMTGYGFGNKFGMNHGLILHTSSGTMPGDPYLNSFPINLIWACIWMPIEPELFPASANDQYLSNFSAMQATDDPTMIKTYSQNIQALNAEYLPVIALTYDGNIMAYSTQRFTGWPTAPNGYLRPAPSLVWNLTAFETLKPVSVSPITTTTTSPVTTTTTTQATGSTDYTVPIALGVVAAVVIIAIAAVALSRRKSSASKT